MIEERNIFIPKMVKQVVDYIAENETKTLFEIANQQNKKYKIQNTHDDSLSEKDSTPNHLFKKNTE
jgi:hypothetical protein